VAGESSYVERVPTPALAALASSVWIQQVGAQPLAQRHMPHGGAEVRCVLGRAPGLLVPLTALTYQEVPAEEATTVGVHPGDMGGRGLGGAGATLLARPRSPRDRRQAGWWGAGSVVGPCSAMVI